MRKEVLGLLACMATVVPHCSSLAFAQYYPGNYGPAPGEPIPIQGTMYPQSGSGQAPFGAYPSPFPSYAPPNWQDMQMPASPPSAMPYAAPPAMPYPPPYPASSGMPANPAWNAAPVYPPPYPPPSFGPAPAPFGTMPAPLNGSSQGIPALPTSQVKPQTAPPPPSPWQAPPPNASLPAGPGPAGSARTPYLVPSEPYLFSETKGGEHSEPFFQQVDAWRAVRGSRMYGYLDYLLWWTNRQTIPSVTTLPGVDLANQVSGTNHDPRSGVRATFGSWITPMKNLAWEASYFYLGEQLLRNTLDIPGAAPDVATLPLFFGVNSQSSTVTATSHLWGAETNLRYQLCAFKTDCVQWFLDLLGGFRYVDLSEGLTAQTNSQFAAAPVLLSGASVTATDNFFTHNNFYGGQLGAVTNVYFWRFNVNVFGKVALGDNMETATINGFTTVVTPLATKSLTGGFLAQPSNIGHHTQNVFAVIPEAGINLDFRVCHYCQLGVGYTFLYLSKVVRPGDQIAPVSNASSLPAGLGGGASQPLFSFQQSHFWATGVNARIMFIF
jgi:hypothetical protein